VNTQLIIPSFPLPVRHGLFHGSLELGISFRGNMIIYKATNLINGKVYIGQTKSQLVRRKNQHIYTAMHSSKLYFHNAIRKYGKDNFDWSVVRVCDNIDEMNVFEQYYILYYDSMNNGYNLTSGGLNWIRTKETRRKLSLANSHRKLSEESKKKIGDANRGNKHTNNAKKKISDASKLMHREKVKNGIIHAPFLNKKHTDKTLKKMVRTSKKLWDSPGYREKMSEAQKLSWKNRRNKKNG